jgi:hypothetical protein
LASHSELVAEVRRGPTADGELDAALEKQDQTEQQQHWIAQQSHAVGDWKPLRLLGCRETCRCHEDDRAQHDGADTSNDRRIRVSTEQHAKRERHADRAEPEEDTQ